MPSSDTSSMVRRVAASITASDSILVECAAIEKAADLVYEGAQGATEGGGYGAVKELFELCDGWIDEESDAASGVKTGVQLAEKAIRSGMKIFHGESYNTGHRIFVLAHDEPEVVQRLSAKVPELAAALTHGE